MFSLQDDQQHIRASEGSGGTVFIKWHHQRTKDAAAILFIKRARKKEKATNIITSVGSWQWPSATQTYIQTFKNQLKWVQEMSGFTPQRCGTVNTRHTSYNNNKNNGNNVNTVRQDGRFEDTLARTAVTESVHGRVSSKIPAYRQKLLEGCKSTELYKETGV